jgi:hypothetical protein
MKNFNIYTICVNDYFLKIIYLVDIAKNKKHANIGLHPLSMKNAQKDKRVFY